MRAQLCLKVQPEAKTSNFKQNDNINKTINIIICKLLLKSNPVSKQTNYM